MPDTLGENIKRAREAVGLTQEQLGHLIGVTGVTIMRYEKGLREPRRDTLRKIADALQVDVYSLADFDTATEMLEEHINGTPETKKAPPAKDGKREVDEEDIKFALFGGGGEITDEMYEEVKEFVRFLKMKHGQQ